MSGVTSITFGTVAISARAASSSGRLSAAAGPAFSCSRLKERRSRREVTTTVSKRPDFCRREFAICCSPMPSESMATSDATPTAIPTVVRELRSRASRRLRVARSVTSLNLTRGLRLLLCACRRSLCRRPKKSAEWRSGRRVRAHA